MEEVHLRYILSTFVNTKMYPQYNYNMLTKRKKRLERNRNAKNVLINNMKSHFKTRG
jgi:protein gp37